MPPPRCWDGEKCGKPWCRFTHPGDPGYDNAPYSKAHKDKMREERAREGVLFSTHTGYASDRRDSHEHLQEPSWGGSRDHTSRQHVSPDPPPKGRDNSGWGNSNTVHGGWGSPAPAEGGWRSPPAPSGGWGEPISAGGWGENLAPSGWGEPVSGGGWGRSASPPTGGWGNPEPSSRRSSSQFENKPPSKSSSSASHRAKATSPTRVPSTSSKDRHRNRDKDRQPDQDRESRREASSPSRQQRSSKPTSSSLAGQSNSPTRRRDSINSEKKPAGDAMDVDPPELPYAVPVTANPTSTPAHMVVSMPPPPLPPSATSQPPGDATPLGGAVPLSDRSIPLPRRPTLTSAPVSTVSTSQPASSPSVMTTTPSTPLSSASITRPAPVASVLTVPPPGPDPISKSIASQKSPAVTSSNDMTSSDQHQGWFEQAKEWIRVINRLIHEIKRRDSAQQLLTRYEGRADPSPKILEEIARERAVVATCEANIQMQTQQFALCLASMHASPAFSSAAAETGLPSVTTGVPTLPGHDEEMAAKILLLEDHVSRVRSELIGLNSTIAANAGAVEEEAKAKEELQAVKDGIRKDAESRAKEVESMKNGASATKSEIGTLKLDVEGMKMEVAKAYKGLGETKIETGKLKAQQDMLRARVERVEHELADVQKERADTSVELEQQFQDLKRQIEQLKPSLDGAVMEPGQVVDGDTEQKKKREREASTLPGDAMDVDEARPVKRVRLSVAPAAGEQQESFPPEATQDIGGPSNERLKQLINKLQDHISILEGEMGDAHVEMSEQIRELQDYVGIEPRVYLPWAEPEHLSRSESVPPAAPSSQAAPATGTRSSAPPELSLERMGGSRPTLQTISEDKPAEPRQFEMLVKIQKDMDRVMDELVTLHSAEGVWPESIVKNLVASGPEILAQLWGKMAKDDVGQPEVNGLKVDGTAKTQDDEEIKSMRAKIAEVEAARATEVAELKADLVKLRAENAETKAEIRELRSIIQEAFTPGNSTNPIARVAATDSTSVAPEVAAIRQLASIVPILLKMTNNSA